MKKLLFAVLYHFGAVRLAAWRNRGRVRILCYHGVTERATRSPEDPAGLHVRRQRFAAQLDYLRRHYQVISLQEYLWARDEGRSLPPYTVVLTFDDGYRNFLTVAAPQLNKRAMPATVYLITGRVRAGDASQRAAGWTESDDTSFLSWAEASALKQSHAVGFGSHTCTHPKLTKLPEADAARELRESRDAIAAHLQQTAQTLAYPYGDYNASLAARAREFGYACALTTDEGSNDMQTDLYALRRTLVGDDDDEAAFAVRVSGLIGYLRRSATYNAPEVSASQQQD